MFVHCCTSIGSHLFIRDCSFVVNENSETVDCWKPFDQDMLVKTVHAQMYFIMFISNVTCNYSRAFETEAMWRCRISAATSKGV